MHRQQFPSDEFQKLVFLSSQTPPQLDNCDNLLYRIRDLFRSEIRINAHARVERDDGLQGTFLRPHPAARSQPACFPSSDMDLEWEAIRPRPIVPESPFFILPPMEVLVLRLNAVDEPGLAFVRVLKDQEGFPQCMDQEGFVESKYLVALPAIPPCNSAAVCLMRCVQRVALRVRTCNFCFTILF
jgi:hypothetical protein